ncbi:MAG: helix-turn-helix domain-containing protein [Candidatus Acidiferrales bacterium]
MRAISNRTPASRAAVSTGSRQQARTAATRRKLLQAAEQLFARDGFEATRLEDIAAEAGYTRGAFYANFDSKEDIFFALLEQWVAQRIEEVNALLRLRQNPAQRLCTLRQYYVQNAKDRRLVLLSLEFKLFAVRHPEAAAGLRARRLGLAECGGKLLQRVAKSLAHSLPVSCAAAATALGGFSHTLFLEHLVDPKSLSDAEIRRLLELVFDAVLIERA